MLMKNRGGGAADLFYATFRDDARTSIANASGPFNSEYQPEQPLSAVIGEPFVGSQPWRIAIKDDYASDFGHVWKRELYLLLD